jgi:hypothetical protein
VVAVFEDHLEVPVRRSERGKPVGNGRGLLSLGRPVRVDGTDVAVADRLQVALGSANGRRPDGLVRRRLIDAVIGLREVLIDGEIALVVEAARDQVGEHLSWISRVGETAQRVEPEECRHVVAADAAPVADPGIRRHPTLDTGKKTFDARPIGIDVVIDPVNSAWLVNTLTALVEHRDQVLRAGKEEHVRLLCVQVARQTFIGLARDRRQTLQAPAEPEGAVPGAGVIRKTQLRAKPRTARTRRDRDGKRTRPRHGVDRELFAYPADRPSALGQRNAGKRAGGASGHRRCRTRRRPHVHRGPRITRGPRRVLRLGVRHGHLRSFARLRLPPESSRGRGWCQEPHATKLRQPTELRGSPRVAGIQDHKPAIVPLLG